MQKWPLVASDQMWKIAASVLFSLFLGLVPSKLEAATARLSLSVSGQIFYLEQGCFPQADNSAEEGDTAASSHRKGQWCVLMPTPFSIPSVEVEIPQDCIADGKAIASNKITLFLNNQPYDPRTSNVGSAVQQFQLRYGLGLDAAEVELDCERSGVLRIRY